ncbi:MAG TPA: galactokinase [Chitinophagales bacterium]|nr:galactokinase [Chitinophagales bacterium]
MVKALKEIFEQHFGRNGEVIHSFFAPGRVCLIGEHLDYNGGFVLPCALSMGTYLLVRKRKDHILKLTSLNYSSSFEISLNEIDAKVGNDWWNYPVGVVNEFQKIVSGALGFEMLFNGDLPISAGLSSSASIEVVTAFSLNELLNTKLSLKEIALLSKRAENDFVGVQCGILDQYAVALGRKNHAMFLNCVTEEHEFIPVNIGDYEFIIANTNKPRQLENSAFNDRFNECRGALQIMQRLLPVNFLADATLQQFDSIEHFFPDEVTRKRAHHIVYEQERVKRAASALARGDVGELAALMNQSHASLRDYYDASCSELETIVSAALSVNGCLASRPSGAGFGGCTINLIRAEVKERFCEKVFSEYKMKTGLNAEFYEVKMEDGVKKFHLQ